ncbi:hypothetical protein LguiB_028345 [Lonicera macranthoides]
MAMEEQIQNLWQEVRELSLGTTPQIDRLPHPPTPLHFLRHYISQNKPCIISSATLHWPATTLWSSPSYLCRTLSSSSVSLHLTPNGKADSLTPLQGLTDQDQAHISYTFKKEEICKPNTLQPTPPSNLGSAPLCFASAHVSTTPFPAALSKILISDLEAKFVAYAQQQNDCFRSEYKEILEDCELDIPWASEALGCKPEAVNLWIGNELSETSFHKDHYENLYAVVSGEKHFLLLPPTDVHRMYVQDYPAAQYSYSEDTREFTLELEDPVRYVPWCSVNPYPSLENKDREMSEFPLYFNGPKPFECTVKAGEILYFYDPNMWTNYIGNSGLTIAVNYWYDMQFDVKYAYFNFLQSIHCLKPHNPIPLLENGDVTDSGHGTEEK